MSENILESPGWLNMTKGCSKKFQLDPITSKEALELLKIFNKDSEVSNKSKESQESSKRSHTVQNDFKKIP